MVPTVFWPSEFGQFRVEPAYFSLIAGYDFGIKALCNPSFAYPGNVGIRSSTYAPGVGWVWKPLAVKGTSCTRFHPCLGGVLRASVVHPPDEVVDHFFGPLHVGGESQA